MRRRIPARLVCLRPLRLATRALCCCCCCWKFGSELELRARTGSLCSACSVLFPFSLRTYLCAAHGTVTLLGPASFRLCAKQSAARQDAPEKPSPPADCVGRRLMARRLVAPVRPLFSAGPLKSTLTDRSRAGLGWIGRRARAKGSSIIPVSVGLIGSRLLATTTAKNNEGKADRDK